MDKFNQDDLSGVISGTLACMQALHKIWPDASVEELHQKLEELQASSLAQELLYMVLQDRKIKVA